MEGMTRDPFSLHKMIVLVTECGALFGVDSLTGDIAWRYVKYNVNSCLAGIGKTYLRWNVA